MKPFIAIIGNRNSGKSTIIRSLTGATTAQFRGTIQDLTTNQTMEVIGSSPQERPLALADLRTLLRTAAGTATCRGVVCALQPNAPTKRLSMEQVLREAASQGFIIHTYVLDPGYSGATGRAGIVTTRIQNAGFYSQVLDGQRFAHINAATINAQTNIAT